MKYRITLVADSSTPLGVFEDVIKKYNCQIAGFEPFDDEDPPKMRINMHPAARTSSVQREAKQSLPMSAVGFAAQTAAGLRKPQFTISDITDVMVAAGYPLPTATAGVKQLHIKGIIVRVGYGTYQKAEQLTNVVELHKKTKSLRPEGMTTHSAVWDYLATLPDESTVEKAGIMAALVALGYNGSSFGPVVVKLQKEGKLEKTGMGAWRVHHVKPAHMVPQTPESSDGN